MAFWLLHLNWNWQHGASISNDANPLLNQRSLCQLCLRQLFLQHLEIVVYQHPPGKSQGSGVWYFKSLSHDSYTYSQNKVWKKKDNNSVLTKCIRKRQSATTWEHQEAALEHVQLQDVIRLLSNTTATLKEPFAWANGCGGTTVALKWKPEKKNHSPCNKLACLCMTFLWRAAPSSAKSNLTGTL